MTTATAYVLPFGKLRGQPIARVGTDYLRWLSSEPGMDARVAGRASGELRRREEAARAEAARLWPLPLAGPRSVCGVALDAVEAGLFEEAAEAGELLVTPDMPLASPVPEAWRRWCVSQGIDHAVRVVPLTRAGH